MPLLFGLLLIRSQRNTHNSTGIDLFRFNAFPQNIDPLITTLMLAGFQMATSPSPSNLGKKPKWHLTDEELLRLPSRICGMAADTELKCRREAACFIQVFIAYHLIIIGNQFIPIRTLLYIDRLNSIFSGYGRLVESQCAKQRTHVSSYHMDLTITVKIYQQRSELHLHCHASHAPLLSRPFIHRFPTQGIIPRFYSNHLLT
jgi:hypothetical protein